MKNFADMTDRERRDLALITIEETLTAAAGHSEERFVRTVKAIRHTASVISKPDFTTSDVSRIATRIAADHWIHLDLDPS